MDPTRTAYGVWSGGRFMHFGEALDEGKMTEVIQRAYLKGVRTFMTADVYGQGAADEMIGQALADFPRDSYCLIGAVGHDYYQGRRDGAKGFPRFTASHLRPANQYSDYLKTATEKALKRCRTEKFDLLLLHNPDSTGYSSDAVWNAMQAVREEGMTDLLGIAPGPANGFTLDLILSFERFGALIDWAMVILNPLEPWPGKLSIPAAEKFDVKLVTRVVDYGGLFHDDVRPGHQFGNGDHRTYRPQGWVESGNEKMDKMRDYANKYSLTMLQLACLWNLSHAPVKTVVPTLIQEASDGAKPIEVKVDELAELPDVAIEPDDVAAIEVIGNNKGCMSLKGGNPKYSGEPVADGWEMNPDLQAVAERWDIRPEEDLVPTH
ncbi:MAG: hypothetical protein M2R45_01852 [Verrucomicrobia subdivision 3 bacterium]|nr:hypothetical protein [Limisphaerales bacterium]MCS1415652.1 hypothetical protein [Limisphaerales bacterium]